MTDDPIKRQNDPKQTDGQAGASAYGEQCAARIVHPRSSSNRAWRMVGWRNGVCQRYGGRGCGETVAEGQ